MYRVNPEKCMGCGVCVASCSQGAPRLEGDTAVIDQDLCIECGTCYEVCPEAAIEEVAEGRAQPAPAAQEAGSSGPAPAGPGDGDGSGEETPGDKEGGETMEAVVHADHVEGVYRIPPRVSKLLISEKSVGARNLSLGMNETAVGSRIPEHAHPEQEEAMFIISGRGMFRISGKEYEVGPGTALFAPPGVPHELVNTGEEPLRLVWCYAPPLPEHRLGGK
ncbi:MAG: cupin domain-containing protein [Bacillota bacterium]|nr:cupin domain-containing protein [Bacillota bacterium]